ncbi:MAG: glycosyltransferase [Lachnospiraceae bacterium]|nr:glycosyltransferase [Lachnospiraceae bacterium]
MTLLFYEWNSYFQYDIKWICKEKGIQLDTFMWKFTDKNEDEAFERWFRENVDESRFDALLSVNYWPMLSKMAQEKGLKYLAWCYDNPLNVINLENTLGNPNNYVFFFDRVQTEKYLKAGFDTVYYLPLGVNSTRLSKLQVSAADRKRYSADVSLVGSLYESRMPELWALMDEYIRGYLDAAMAVQQNLYGYYLFDELVTDELVERINGYIREQHPETDFQLLKEALTFAMASDVTRKERLVLLTILGRRFDTRLYSFQGSNILEGVKCFPPVDYISEMPKVFTCSRVNLNPVLRCVQSGIPLRALDVMGMGGFLLSSWQMELVEQFEHEGEMVVYESIEDAVEKVGFYLKHEDIRKQIAGQGREKVLKNYSLQSRLQTILEIAEI